MTQHRFELPSHRKFEIDWSKFARLEVFYSNHKQISLTTVCERFTIWTPNRADMPVVDFTLLTRCGNRDREYCLSHAVAKSNGDRGAKVHTLSWYRDLNSTMHQRNNVLTVRRRLKRSERIAFGSKYGNATGCGEHRKPGSDARQQIGKFHEQAHL